MSSITSDKISPTSLKRIEVITFSTVEKVIRMRYKSNVCHQVKAQGDIGFIIKTLEEDSIRKYYQRSWYPESLYLLAMLDYLSRLNDIPLCTQYDDLRRSKLSTVIYPSGVLAAAIVSKSDKVKQQALTNAIPEFIRFNIVESEVRNVF